ncbi:MAG: hypothetical protein RJA59_1849, partial [Pseudomonadota bacterium]
MSEATISVRVGDEETAKMLGRQGSRLRDNVTRALVAETARTLADIRAGAPTKRSAEGVKAYGTEQPDRPSGSGVPRAMLDVITRTSMLASKGELATVIANTYYLARFREEGFDGTVDVRAHTRRARGRKGWARSGFVGK